MFEWFESLLDKIQRPSLIRFLSFILVRSDWICQDQVSIWSLTVNI